MTTPRPESHRMAPARMAADNGSESEAWGRIAKKVGIKYELRDIERLADRITIQVSAYRQLGNLTGGMHDDGGVTLRVIGLALKSIHEALTSVEQRTHAIDLAEYGSARPRTGIQFHVEYGSNIEAIEDYANDLGIQANAQEYMLALNPGERRPDQLALEYMRFMVNAMGSILASHGSSNALGW